MFGKRPAERKGPAPDAAVVGLGNPGDEYAQTRHNVGFFVCDRLVAAWGGSWRASKQRALVAEPNTPYGRLLVAQPQTYMNLSGESVKALLKSAGLPPEKLLVVHDELDLPLGTLRIKQGGGTAGHQGLNSIVRCLGTKEFARLRFGIGRPPGRMPAADYVLRKFKRDEADEVAIGIERSVEMVASWLDAGVEATQNAFHGG